MKKNHIMKSAARLYAVQALFQMEASKVSIDTIIVEFKTHRIGKTVGEDKYPNADIRLFRGILNKAVKSQGTIDKLTNITLKDSWHLNRIDPTLRALFRAATAELLLEEAPPKAVINEFLEISKAFFPNGKEIKLVNGVLDKILSLIEKK